MIETCFKFTLQGFFIFLFYLPHLFGLQPSFWKVFAFEVYLFTLFVVMISLIYLLCCFTNESCYLEVIGREQDASL